MRRPGRPPGTASTTRSSYSARSSLPLPCPSAWSSPGGGTRGALPDTGSGRGALPLGGRPGSRLWVLDGLSRLLSGIRRRAGTAARDHLRAGPGRAEPALRIRLAGALGHPAGDRIRSRGVPRVPPGDGGDSPLPVLRYSTAGVGPTVDQLETG